MAVGVSAALGVGCAVPGVAAAFDHRGDLIHWIVDGEVEGIDLCAAVGIFVAVCVGVALVVGLAITVCPLVAAASRFGSGSVCWIVDGEVEGDDGVATVGTAVLNGEGRFVGAFVVRRAINPGVGAASLLLVNARRGIVDGQVQGIDLRAAVGVFVAVGVGAALGVGCAVPRVAAASRFGDGCVGRIVDGKVEGIDLRAPVVVFVAVEVVSAFGVGYAINPSEGAASRLLVKDPRGLVEFKVGHVNSVVRNCERVDCLGGNFNAIDRPVHKVITRGRRSRQSDGFAIVVGACTGHSAAFSRVGRDGDSVCALCCLAYIDVVNVEVTP